MDFGDRLRTLRESKGYSQFGVAKGAGLSRQHYGKIEQGKSKPNLKTLEKITSSLGISLEEFYRSRASGDYKNNAHKDLHEALQILIEADASSLTWAKELIEMRLGWLSKRLAKTKQDAAISPTDLNDALSRLAVTDLTDPEALAGPRVSAEIHEFPGLRPVGVHRLQSAAGSGALDLDEEIKTYAYFRHEWLSRHGLIADRCRIIGVMGESMEPTLPDGCVILLDRNRTRRRDGHIFVVRTEDGLVVKRAGKDKKGNWQLLSDHPEWKPVSWPEDTVVIGEVKWSAVEL